MKIHHIGYLVKRLEPAVLDFENMGYTYEDLSEDTLGGGKFNPVMDESRGIRIVFMRNGSYRVELVEPLGKDSPIYGLLKKYKNSPYHICYSTSDMSASINSLEQLGWMLFESPAPAPAIHGCNVAFLMSANSGMIELVEDMGENTI